MQLTLTITETQTLPAAILQAFIENAQSEGKTAEEKLAELITKESEKQKGGKA